VEQDEIHQEFDRRRPTYARLVEEARHILHEGLSASAIKLHSISSRIKEFPSFAGKMDRRQTEKPFEEITDIVGLSLHCQTER